MDVVPIKRPSTPDAEECRIQENCFSINFQGVCISNLKPSDTVVCCKGPIRTPLKEFSPLILVSFREGHIMDKCWGPVVMLSHRVHPVQALYLRQHGTWFISLGLFFTLFLPPDEENHLLLMSAFSCLFGAHLKVLSHKSIQLKPNRRDMIYWWLSSYLTQSSLRFFCFW